MTVELSGAQLAVGFIIIGRSMIIDSQYIVKNKTSSNIFFWTGTIICGVGAIVLFSHIGDSVMELIKTQ